MDLTNVDINLPYNRKYYLSHRWMNTGRAEVGTAIVLEGELGPCHLWKISLPTPSFQYLTFLPQGLILWQTGTGRAALLQRSPLGYTGHAFIEGRDRMVQWTIEQLLGEDVRMLIKLDNQPYLEIVYLSLHRDADIPELAATCPYLKDIAEFNYLPLIHQQFCLIIFIFICLISSLVNDIRHPRIGRGNNKTSR